MTEEIQDNLNPLETTTDKPTLGRPPFYKTPEEMQCKIDEYFKKCQPEFIRDEAGKILRYKLNPPTVSGLGLFLGFECRASIYDYAKKPEFTYTIKRAILSIEQYAEDVLLSGDKPTGAIFWLKNHGWTAEEKREETHNIDLSGSLKVDNAQTVKEAVREVFNECFDTSPKPEQ